MLTHFGNFLLIHITHFFRIWLRFIHFGGFIRRNKQFQFNSMSASVNMIHWLTPIFNITTLIPDTTSYSLVPFQKCCGYDQLLAAKGLKCVSVGDDARLLLHLNLSRLKIHFGFPCGLLEYKDSQANVSRIGNFHYDGSVKVHFSNEEIPHVLEWGQYCIDVLVWSPVPYPNILMNRYHPILITCGQLSVLTLPGPVLFFYLFSSVSILLTFTTLILYLAIPELRAKVKDKCFICFLVFLTFMLLIAFWMDLVFSFSPNDKDLLSGMY